MTIDQILQISGALLIVAGYIGAQMELVRTSSLSYLWANLIGSTLLAILAFQGRQWGFLLLESVWAVVSLVGLLGQYRTLSPDQPTRPD